MASNGDDDDKKKLEGSTTTVLDAGTVESRGIGTRASCREEVSQDILDFLNNEGKLSPSAETRALFTVWIFITRLPAPMWVDLHPAYLMRGMTYFPLAGMIVGILVSCVFDFCSVLIKLPPVVAAGMSQAASFFITLFFHEDGLGDAADGIGGGWTRRQVLKIMTDTRLGTYGVCVLILHTFLKLQLLGALGISTWNWNGEAAGAGPAIVLMHALSRLTAPYLIRTRPYVDEVGPKSPFYSFMVQAKYLVSWDRVGFAVMTCYWIATLFYGYKTAAVLILVVLAFAHSSGSFGEYILGGVMGDYLGATICVTEILVLTMILVKDDVVATCLDIFETLKNNVTADTFIGLLTDAWREPNTPVGVLIRFVVIMSLATIWSKNVGYPPINYNEGLSEDTQKVTADKANGEMSAPSARQEAESICKASESTFQQRYDAARDYLDCLAKPVGSLGTLEDWAARLVALQRTTRPTVDPVTCLIFAGDHGAAKALEDGGEGCSSYPQAVTRSVLVGLEREIAGASVLAKANNVRLRVIDVGVAGGASNDNNVVVVSPNKLQGGGTRNFCNEAAMTSEEVERCIRIGRDELVRAVVENKSNAVVLGEVGIGNTTSSSALVAQFTKADVSTVCGGGATLAREADQAAVSKKVTIVKKALKRHGSSITSGADALAKLGGAEIASLVGAMLEASERSVPVLVDGFIVTAAALVATNMSPNTCRILFFSSQSAEKGQLAAIKSIQDIAMENGIPISATPALAMNLRMGEATAALLAVPILRSAAAVVADMGTIQDILGS